jgi:hypothetical protein
MTRLNHLAPRTKMISRHRVRRAAHGPAREARIRRSFDGVVASYIRELATAGDRAPEKGVTWRALSGSGKTRTPGPFTQDKTLNLWSHRVTRPTSASNARARGSA